MRVFWALMAALILAGGAVLFMRERPSTATAPRVAETAARPVPAPMSQPLPATPATPVTEQLAVEETVIDAPVVEAAVETPVKAVEEQPAAVEATQVVQSADDAQTPAQQPEVTDTVEATTTATTAPDEPAAEAVEEAVVDAGEAPAPPAPETAPPASEEASSAPVPAVAVTTREEIEPRAAPEGDADAAGDAVRPDAVERREDGTYLIGGAHVVTGEGTVDKPFEVSWEMLISASRVYRPKQGKLDLPEWAALLNGKQVRITGFIAFPFVADAASECLLMLNQWDGCCIGVPPTPYDAIEVKLGVPLDLTRQAINYGSIRGTFSVDPYLVNNFLVGLYVMDDGVVEASAARDAQGY
ncbi:MAG: hypothetical protein KJZ54_05215 [Phycisphaerales bacterium]|nr:hypothetical protein [Phycisphaerales bacterium]